MPYAINMNLIVGAKDEALLSNITTVENKKKKKREKNKRNSPRFQLIDNVFWLGDFVIFAMLKAKLLIVKWILLVSTLEIVSRTVWRMCKLILGCKE